MRTRAINAVHPEYHQCQNHWNDGHLVCVCVCGTGCVYTCVCLGGGGGMGGQMHKLDYKHVPYMYIDCAIYPV